MGAIGPDPETRVVVGHDPHLVVVRRDAAPVVDPVAAARTSLRVVDGGCGDGKLLAMGVQGGGELADERHPGRPGRRPGGPRVMEGEALVVEVDAVVVVGHRESDQRADVGQPLARRAQDRSQVTLARAVGHRAEDRDVLGVEARHGISPRGIAQRVGDRRARRRAVPEAANAGEDRAVGVDRLHGRGHPPRGSPAAHEPAWLGRRLCEDAPSSGRTPAARVRESSPTRGRWSRWNGTRWGPLGRLPVHTDRVGGRSQAIDAVLS